MNAWTGNKCLYKLGCADSWIDSLHKAYKCALYFVHMLNTFLAVETLLSYLERLIRGASALV